MFKPVNLSSWCIDVEKMASSFESLSSIYSSSAHLSIKNQTKDKFDALLKTAKQKKKTKLKREMERDESRDEFIMASTENLIDKNQTDDLQLTTFSEHDNENYILNKFLDQQSDRAHTNGAGSVEGATGVQGGNAVNVKAPVPKPRKKKRISPTESQGTFEVTSPKVVKNPAQEATSPASDKTYNVEPIGDILIDKSPLKPKIIIKDNNIKHADSTDSDILSADELKSSKSEDNAIIEKPVNKKKNISEDDENVLNKKTYTYEKIINITVHKTDRLQLSSLVVHPVVKIHVVDARTGKYFLKSDKTRPVVFFYENRDTDYISPVMTHTYNLQERRILYPSWEEIILINEDYEYFKDESSHILLFFELADFVSFAMLQQLSQKDCDKGWHNIAFAFLQLSGPNGKLNFGKKVRLQLFYSHQSRKNDPQICNAWTWWKKKKLKKYPSSLYVTIKATISPRKVVESFRSKTPVQRETSSKTKLCDDTEKREILENLPDTVGLSNDESRNEFEKENISWTRTSNEICRLPNKSLADLNSYDCGCFVMKFSHNGCYLACAVQNDNLFSVIVYAVLSLHEVHKFPSHQALIYNIKWSSDDVFLLTASADNTVSVFSLFACSFFQILPHPTFVYCCDICPNKIIASGCYDGIVRIWNYEKTDKKMEYRLFQELEAHTGYITSLCFNSKSNIFSSDSTGIIIEWQKDKNDWILKRQIGVLDLKETIINQIILFPKEKKLLVHSRDNTIRIVDLKSGCVLQWLRGALNKRFQIFCSISPCGAYVFSGSENGFVHVWNAKNGREIAAYMPFVSSEQHVSTIHCVEFHPQDNIMAISHYGKNVPILLFSFDESIEQPTIHVKFNDEYSEKHPTANNSLKESKLKSIVKRNLNPIKRDEKVNFKRILQKMDSVIMTQTH